MRESIISFPGLGIEEFTLKATAFSFQIGKLPITVMWYGIIICIGIFAGFGYFAYRGKKAGLSMDDVFDTTLVTVITAIVGARLYYVIFYGGYLETDGTFWQNVGGTLYNIIAVWNGGLAIYGGIIGGFLALLIISKWKKVGVFKLTDMVVPGVMLGQLIGRWGNFCNGEAYGTETVLPWRMGLCNYSTGWRTIYVHPTFLYESLWNLVGFILINIFYKKKKYHGEITVWYFSWYGLGRAFIELLRTDSLMIGSFRVSSLLSFLLVLILVPLGIYFHMNARKMEKAGISPMDTHFTIMELLPFIKRKEDASKIEKQTLPTDETPAETSSEDEPKNE